MQSTLEQTALDIGNDSDDQTRSGTGIYTTMTYLVVDGIVSQKAMSRRHRTDPVFKLKDEFDDHDYPSDTGGLSFRHVAKPVSEKHWLKCGAVIELGDFCHVCGQKVTEVEE